MPSAPGSRARLVDLTSEISELRRQLPSTAAKVFDIGDGEAGEDAVPITMPGGGWPRLAGVLVEMAAHHAVLKQTEEARGAAFDALLLLDILEGNVEWPERAKLSCTLGEVLLELHEAHRARERFVEAAEIFEEHGDLEAAAKARVGLARALVALNDPLGRAILEDAGSMFEDLGDHEAARAIDFELREVEAMFEESPRSFQAVARPHRR